MMRISFKKVLATALLITNNFSLATEDRIIMAVGASYAEPYIFLDQNKNLKDGIIKRFGDAIATEMAMNIEYKIIPVMRVFDSLFKNETNMVCFENESWNPEMVNKVNWTPVVFQEREVIVTPITTKFSTLQDLKGNIGTIVGYSYPKIQSLFDKNQLERVDNTSLEANFMKLKNKRIDMILDENIPISYIIRKQNLSNSFKVFDSLSADGKILYDVVNRYDLKCIYNNSLNQESVNKAFKALKEKGSIQNILAAYGRVD